MPALSDQDIDRIAAALGVQPERADGVVKLALSHADSGRHLRIEIYDADSDTAIVKAYGRESHLELHGCIGAVALEELGETIFFARTGGQVSGLVVEKGAGCSLYANVSEDLLSRDFIAVPLEQRSASLQLSMCEPMLDGSWSPEA